LLFVLTSHTLIKYFKNCRSKFALGLRSSKILMKIREVDLLGNYFFSYTSIEQTYFFKLIDQKDSQDTELLLLILTSHNLKKIFQKLSYKVCLGPSLIINIDGNKIG